MKDMYSKPTNRTELSVPISKKPCVATLYMFLNVCSKNVPEQLVQESTITFEIYGDHACLKVSRETLTTIDPFLEQSRFIQSIYSM